jgi:murein DD-endopeptidase MepM/ murein hydrolase activator NlpD
VRHVGRRVATASFSVGVMGIVGLMAVGMTTPAAAVSAVSGSETTSLVSAQGDVTGPVEKQDIQAYVAPGDVESASLDRPESYSSVSMGQIAAEEGITNYSNFYVNDPNAAIQWPFKVGVGITFGFGMRDGRMHEGADFVPGEGADVQAIADGTVRIATESGGAFGVTVLIDHIIDGQLVSSRYAHMLYGSLRVKAGDHVTVGTILGNTGNTGRSFGAHTHVEILQNGTTPIDPIAWFREYAGRSSLG